MYCGGRGRSQRALETSPGLGRLHPPLPLPKLPPSAPTRHYPDRRAPPLPVPSRQTWAGLPVACASCWVSSERSPSGTEPRGTLVFTTNIGMMAEGRRGLWQRPTCAAAARKPELRDSLPVLPLCGSGSASRDATAGGSPAPTRAWLPPDWCLRPRRRQWAGLRGGGGARPPACTSARAL